MNIKYISTPVFVLALTLLTAGFYRVVAQTPDPGVPGTHTVIKTEYNLGDLAYAPPAAAMFPANMEVIGSVHYPSDLSTGPFPVIMILHGRHSTCYDSVTLGSGSGWPCSGRDKPITSYEGYDYLATNMASHGYIVISISSNAINAIDGGLSDAGMNARGVLVQHHLDLWNKWNTVGGFPGDSTLFIRKLNMKNIGTMGHSRGGEGVVFNAEYNRSLGSPYGINAVLTLAPVDFYRHVLNGIPLLNVAPYCDGDVNDLQGVHFYDDARYNDTTDQAAKHNILFLGANHNFFNTVWTPGSYVAGGFDDWLYSYSNTAPWCGAGATATGRFDTATQKSALLPYFSAFYRLYLGHEEQFAPILNADDTMPPASSHLHSSQVHVSFHPSRMNRLDLNRTDSLDKLTNNTLRDTVSEGNFLSSQVCGGGAPETDCGVLGSFQQAQQPHNSGDATLGLSQMGMQWDTSIAFYQNDLPRAYENLGAYQDLIFRTSVNFSQSPVDSTLNFSVELIDSAGSISSQPVGNYTHALFYQPGSEPGDLPKLVFNTVKMPLSAFTGINKAKVRKVRFLFNKSKKGSLFISDLAFSNTPCSGLTALFTDSISASRYHVTFTNTSMANTTDTVKWYWNFGDILSGTRDTSTLRTPPVHTYPTHGTYNACLYVTSTRKNGYICRDTFCKAIVVPIPVEVATLEENNSITIAPNPASDHLYITGAAPTDILTLTDLYGRTVLTTLLTRQDIRLPENLATGVYYVMINTGTGRVYKKLLIRK